MNYIVFKTDGSFLSLFDTLDKTDNFFIQDTAFDTVADWVEEMDTINVIPGITVS